MRNTDHVAFTFERNKRRVRKSANQLGRPYRRYQLIRRALPDHCGYRNVVEPKAPRGSERSVFVDDSSRVAEPFRKRPSGQMLPTLDESGTSTEATERCPRRERRRRRQPPEEAIGTAKLLKVPRLVERKAARNDRCPGDAVTHAEGDRGTVLTAHRPAEASEPSNVQLVEQLLRVLCPVESGVARQAIRKTDPGPAFDWPRLQLALTVRGTAT